MTINSLVTNPALLVEDSLDCMDEKKAESAAARKKRNKKEKEKQKKKAAAALECKEEKKEMKTEEKKGRKQVQIILETLARCKEIEERMEREEEERLRKEEEVHRQQEELERQAEEARRQKKEREKEKLMKKKLEGKPITAKQKQEARRLAAIRTQFLANMENLPTPTSGTAVMEGKRPICQTKKAKPPHSQANHGGLDAKAWEGTINVLRVNWAGSIAESHSAGTEMVKDVECRDLEWKSEVGHGMKEKGSETEDTEDEWDAKNWDDQLVSLAVKSTFSEEEVDSEPEHVLNNETKPVMPMVSCAAGALLAEEVPMPPLNNIALLSTESHKVECEGNQHDFKVTQKKSEETAMNRQVKISTNLSEKSEEDFRAPICCVMGHVDSGKTKLLDCIRGTNVQASEAGGITQQVGATYIPIECIQKETSKLKADAMLRVPGVLFIDTPGHESFTNIRTRGSHLCDISILVVDIMHGLKPQTIESLHLLREGKTEFIIALNKVDRLYGWKTCPKAPIQKAIEQQSKDVQNEFNSRLTSIVSQFKAQGFNASTQYKKMKEVFSIVPMSAVSGEGIPDLLALLVNRAQKEIVKKLMFSDKLQCTVLDVNYVEGHGTTIDVVLINGMLHEGDQIVISGIYGPIITTIRTLLMPQPMKELQGKGFYQHHKEIKGAQSVKIAARGLEYAIAGTALYVPTPANDLETIKELVMADIRSVTSRIEDSGDGILLHASSLGSLEALLEFLKSSKVDVPVSGRSIGPVHKRDVTRATVMLKKKREYATILAFGVQVEPGALDLAKETGVRIFSDHVMYKLCKKFENYLDNLKEERKKKAAEEAVFPCVLRIIPDCVFNKSPIVVGVDILQGIVKVGTPICVPSRDFIGIGKIESIRVKDKLADIAKKGQDGVAIKIVGPEKHQKQFTRHLDSNDELVSHITRMSIDVLEANYRGDLSKEEWNLVQKLMKIFKIP